MNLFVNYYVDKNEERNEELRDCLQQNIHALNKIYLIGDAAAMNKAIETYIFDDHHKIIQIAHSPRPTYKDFFNTINRFTQPNDINIIANSDIYFQDINEIYFENLTHNDCYALSRWDVQPDGSAVHYNNSGSQDTWIFRGAIKMVEGANFTQGIAGCDNKIAYLLQQAGYNVTNPSLSIKTYHLHLSNVRSYDRDKNGRPARKVYRLPHPRTNVPIT